MSGTGVAAPGYELLGELGRGGMGVVYKARHVKLNRLVALKMILSGGDAGVGEMARFKVEAEAMARFQHPNIVQIYEVGEVDGKPFFSLEFVEGGSLADKLDGTPLPSPQCARLVETLAKAVHAAHQRGIVHRDLKPANVLLTADGQPKITDFGLAKQLDSEKGQTQSGAIMGTPSYMAPEQAGGKSKDIGPATDVYALGTILYELVTGRPPFKATTPLDTVLQVVSEEPVPPSRLQPKVPRDLETICLKCLQKESSKRYPSALDLAEDLHRWQTGEPIAARPVGCVERTWRWCRRKPLVASLTGAIALLLVAGISISSYFAVQANERAEEAEDSAEQAKAEKKQANKERKQAKAEKERARKNEFAALQHLYFRRIRQAYSAWKDGQVAHVLKLLDMLQPDRMNGHDVRGFEWFYLNRVCHSDLRTLSGHNYPVLSVAFSPNGQYIASAGGGKYTPRDPDRKRGFKEFIAEWSGPPLGEVRIWDVATAREVFRLKSHHKRVTCVTFSPDGKYLASAGENVKVWDVTSGKLVTTLLGQICAAFSPNGKLLATALQGPAKKNIQLTVWDWATGKKLQTFKVFPITNVAFSSDGKRLAVASGYVRAIGEVRWAREVSIWAMDKGQKLLTFKPAGGVASIALTTDGTRIALACGDKKIRVCQTVTGQEEASFSGHRFAVTSVAYSRDGKTLASASKDQTVRVWDAAGGKQLRVYQGHTAGVTGVAFSPDGKRLASAGEDKRVKIWDVTQDQEALTIKPRTEFGKSLAFHPDGKQLVSAGDVTTLWDATTGKKVRSLKIGVRIPIGGEFADPTTGKKVRSDKNQFVKMRSYKVAFSRDGKRLATYCSTLMRDVNVEGEVVIWDFATGKQISSFRNECKAFEMAFSPDGKHMALPGPGGVTFRNAQTGKKGHLIGVLAEVRIGNASTGKIEGTLQAEAEVFSCMGFSPDSRFLATGSKSLQGEKKALVKLWDLASGKKIRQFGEQGGSVFWVAFSPDGRRLASVGSNRVAVWDRATGKEVLTFRIPNSSATAFTDDGKRLAASDEDGNVTIWELMTGQQVLSLKAFTGRVVCLAFNSHGTRLAAIGSENGRGVMKVWDATTLHK
jgi:WD40 repeat protein/tRNA A-37 threonylcarbamoyl transferase component Bud32